MFAPVPSWVPGQSSRLTLRSRRLALLERRPRHETAEIKIQNPFPNTIYVNSVSQAESLISGINDQHAESVNRFKSLDFTRSTNLHGGAKNGASGPSYLIANILKTPWPNSVKIGELLQNYTLNTVINFLFKNFIALWAPPSENTAMSFIHTVQRIRDVLWQCAI